MDSGSLSICCNQSDLSVLSSRSCQDGSWRGPALALNSFLDGSYRTPYRCSCLRIHLRPYWKSEEYLDRRFNRSGCGTCLALPCHEQVVPHIRKATTRCKCWRSLVCWPRTSRGHSRLKRCRPDDGICHHSILHRCSIGSLTWWNRVWKIGILRCVRH